MKPARNVVAVSLLGRDARAEALRGSLEVEQVLAGIAADRHELPTLRSQLRQAKSLGFGNREVLPIGARGGASYTSVLNPQ